MDEFNFNLSDNEDEEDQAPSHRFHTNREAIIFLIDASKPMFEKKDDESPFETCLKCAKSVMQNKIIQNDKDLIGIVLFATEKSTNEVDFKHIYMLQGLDQPGAEKILELEKLIDSLDTEESKYGHSNDYLLSDALWTCLNMFSQCKVKLQNKKILLFTNNDNPHSDDEQHKKQALSRVDDLKQNNIELVLMHINKPQHQFDVRLFYKSILNDEESSELPDPSERFEELLTRVRIKSHTKRMLQQVPFVISPDLSMAVGVYNLSQACHKPAPIKLYKKTNEEVKTVCKTFLKENGELLSTQDMKKCVEIANTKVCFEMDEIVTMKTFDNPGLYLIGFKKKSLIKPYFHIRPAQFIYPDEKTAPGSTTLFVALLKKCTDLSMVIICRYIPRKNTPPKFVALWPQEEEMDENKVQLTPPGFHIIFLPYADDFRKVNFEEDALRATAAQVDKAKELVKKLQFQFNSDSFENPQLQQYYNNVEAMALARDCPEEISDFTQPDEEKIEKRAGKLIKEFKELVQMDKRSTTAANKKKNAPNAVGGGKTSKHDDELDVEKEARNGKLNRLTVPILKECIKKLNIKSTGTKKAELIEAINEHFGI
ncbi:hypothetical protein HELRODRAFT_192857 [Helobdella robusta]|uniref:DNA helicase n=1 Tax=Helobdella robusta TaxID=6412 RepID=T1FUD3_HELRO|nr:hypothetical protein HELRODRAFT_192857 [Helobdella robusta]ESN99570.1 hypothetical protein HELRODRAFT_192857 [Helobdella robusta]